MNYSQYLQAGGTIKDQLRQLVEGAMNQDPEATKQIESIMQAAQSGDSQAQQMASMIEEIMQELQGGSEGIPANKCGGKVTKKVRKHACGSKAKKAQEGAELEAPVIEEKCGGKAKKAKKAEFGLSIKKANTGCKCMLKRVGGKLIQVNSCTGEPILKNGGELIPKHLTGATMMQRWNALKNDAKIRFGKAFGNAAGALTVDPISGLYADSQGQPMAIVRNTSANAPVGTTVLGDVSGPGYVYGTDAKGISTWHMPYSVSVMPDGRISAKPSDDQATTNRERYNQEYNDRLAQEQEQKELAEQGKAAVTVKTDPRQQLQLSTIGYWGADDKANSFYKNWSPEQIKMIQRSLIMKGYNPGVADGKMGKNTLAAIKAFQTDNGLTADGMWGEKTSNAAVERTADNTFAKNYTANIGLDETWAWASTAAPKIKADTSNIKLSRTGGLISYAQYLK